MQASSASSHESDDPPPTTSTTSGANSLTTQPAGTHESSATLAAELKEPSPARNSLSSAASEADGSTPASVPRSEAGEGQEPVRRDKGKERAKEDALERFSCHICLDVPNEPVVTPCGHLHCWPCMHEWLVVSAGRACPVCKAPLSVEKLVPIYSGQGEEADPRSIPIPPRPRPAQTSAAPSYRRTAPTAFSRSNADLASGGSSFSFHAGMFPLTGFSFGWSWPPTPTVGGIRSAGEDDDVFVLRDPHGAGATLLRPGGTAARGRGVEQTVPWMVLQHLFMIAFFAMFVAITFGG